MVVAVRPTPISLRHRISATENRKRQIRAELRLEEIIKVAGIVDTYEAVDRHGDLAVETAFARCYQLVDSDEEKAAIADAFVVWQRSERAEDLAVRGETDEAVSLLKRHNPVFVEGQYVPSGSDGAA
jgi:hypothetical protein